jgi:beta-lactamase superfamily II metal-dependent hydrolase
LPFLLLVLLLAPAGMLHAQSGTLVIYWIDVEGGGATLVVSPAGESLLIDAGFPRPDDRDAKRIYAVIQAAGLKKIDYYMLTHFHLDHAGGLDALVKMIPIGRYFDHGGTVEKENQQWLDSYKRNSEGKRTILKLGAEIPVKGVKVQAISSNMAYQTELLGGDEPNLLCEDAGHKPPDSLENQRNLAVLFTFGRFKFLDPGDMPWERELELACPINKLGTVTLYQTAKHGGWDGGGAPAFINAIKPQVVVVNNGANKGLGIPRGHGHYERITRIPGIEGIWEEHMSPEGPEHNAPENMIANVDKNPEHTPVYWIKASVAQDGKFTVTNTRNGFSKSYTTR